MTGSLIGPAFGPFIGGVIVTYSSWRTIFWLQTAMAGTALIGVFFLLPETIHRKGLEDLEGLSRRRKTREILGRINPIRAVRLFRYPNLALATAGSAGLVWNMYSLLTPIRYVLNPRFHLQTPILGALFYLAPGCGYLIGTLGGGRWADRTVKKWIKKRGKRVPEDRLRASLPFMGIIVPGCILIYGWTVDKAVGGIPVPVIVLFIQGVAQLFCFPALNTYCLDVMPGRGAEATAANFFVRYLFGCFGTAVVLPAIEGIGVGWFSTISVLLMLAGTVGTMAAVRWGPEWREKIEVKEKEKRRQKRKAAEGVTARPAAEPSEEPKSAAAMTAPNNEVVEAEAIAVRDMEKGE
jgi:MFS family permease